jgi:Fic family protein
LERAGIPSAQITCPWTAVSTRLQADYYGAIARCHSDGNSNAFIEFMLDKILETLALALSQMRSADSSLSEYERRLLDAMAYDVPYTASQLMAALRLKSKEALRRNYLHPALQKGLIVMGLPDKPTSRNQTYIKR